MSAEQNKQLLQRIFDELAEGNSRPLVEAMADGFSWTVTGRTRWSRRHEGKQALLDELLGPLRARIEGRVPRLPAAAPSRRAAPAASPPRRRRSVTGG